MAEEENEANVEQHEMEDGGNTAEKKKGAKKKKKRGKKGKKKEIPWHEGNPEEVFELISCLDEGSSGQVWKAQNKDTNEIVAVKVVAKSERVLEELRRETNFLQQVNSEFIIKYHTSYKTGDEVWIVMELAEVGSLHDLMQICDRKLDEQEIRLVCASVLLGLDYLHSNGLIHRDIKAKNILLNANGRVKLADFGIAASVTGAVTKRHTTIGSPHWMAPEVLEGKEYDNRVDIWSLGITMIEMKDKEPPFADIEPVKVIFIIPENPPPTITNKHDFSSVAHGFLSECLQKDPEKRKTARGLLNHPFVREEVAMLRNNTLDPNNKLKQLVDECIEEIDLFREEEDLYRGQFDLPEEDIEGDDIYMGERTAFDQEDEEEMDDNDNRRMSERSGLSKASMRLRQHAMKRGSMASTKKSMASRKNSRSAKAMSVSLRKLSFASIALMANSGGDLEAGDQNSTAEFGEEGAPAEELDEEEQRKREEEARRLAERMARLQARFNKDVEGLRSNLD